MTTPHIQLNDVAPFIAYVGDGTQTQFTFPFAIFTADDLQVFAGDQLVDNYSVSGSGASSSGFVQFATAPAAGTRVTLRRRLSIQRTTDFHEGSTLRAATLNNELDYLVACAQQTAHDVSRALALSPTEAPVDLAIPSREARANRLLGFDTSGRPMAVANDVGADTVMPLSGNTGLLLAEWLEQTMNVRAFGAQGDGIADDTQAFQAALNAAAGRTTLFVPKGRYRITATLQAGPDAGATIHVQGANSRASVIVWDGGAAPCLRIRSNRSSLAGLSFQGPTTHAPESVGVLIEDEGGVGPRMVTLRDVVVQHFGTGIVDNGFTNQVEGCEVSLCDDGYRHSGGGGHTVISHCYFFDVANYGLSFSGGVTHMRVVDTNIETCKVGVFTGGSAAAAQVIGFENVHFEGNHERDIRLGEGVRDAYLQGCRLSGPNSRTVEAITCVGGPQPSRLRLSECTFINEGSASNTTVISAGLNVTLCMDGGLDGEAAGLSRANIAIDATANLQVSGVIGKLAAMSGVSGTVTLDMASGAFKQLVLAGSTTLATPTNVVEAQLYAVRLVQGAVGYAVGFAAGWHGAPAIATTPNSSRTTLWIGLESGNGVAFIG